MAGEKVKIKKVLTHDFEVKGEVQNFDDIMKKILDDVRDKVTFLSFEYNNASIFKANSITNLIVNVKQQIGATISYPIVHGLVGLSLGNQSLNLISFELEQSEATESEPVHDHYKLQIYNPTEIDIVSDVKLQLVCNGSY
jgi:small nuclear ribonucleoprotein (snRNP)-like protein